MSLQGNLRDFAATEILQLLGAQKKTGCLILERQGQSRPIYVHEGRIVASRTFGMSPDDPLLRFLLRARRLSNEQYRGIVTIQRESNRDLEDLLVNGRYLDVEELSVFIERQIFDELMIVVRWADGTYRFDPHQRWTAPALVRLSIEGALIEAARRVDEEKRFANLARDPQQILGVRDLPTANDHLAEEECELFGIIDGNRTIAEIIESAPLSEYEAYEALQRMLEANWVEVVGRREVDQESGGGAPAVLKLEPMHATPSRASSGGAVVKQLIVAACVVLGTVGLWAASHALVSAPAAGSGEDGFAEARLRDLRYTLDLYDREKGRYPARLDELKTERWIGPEAVRVDGRAVLYQPSADGSTYRLELAPAGRETSRPSQTRTAVARSSDR
jgi:hypothetical protein